MEEVAVAVVEVERVVTCTGLRTLGRREEGAAPGRRPEGGARCTTLSQVRRCSHRTCCTARRQAEHTWVSAKLVAGRTGIKKRLCCFLDLAIPD